MWKLLFTRIAFIVGGGAAGVLTMSLTVAQPPLPNVTPPGPLPLPLTPTAPAAQPIQPVTGSATPAAVAPPPRPTFAYDRFRNLDSLPEQTRHMVLSALRGVEWLCRYNQDNGLFARGYLPAVNQPLEGESQLEQAMAAFALARVAHFTGDDRYAVPASHAVLTLLSGTAVEPPGSGIRRPAQPSFVCNRLATAGFLAMAIYELPDANADLLGKAEELCAFIRQQQRPDGSLSYVDAPADDPRTVDPAGVNKYPGPALAAVAMSVRKKPAPWKIEFVARSAAFYRQWFRQHPHPDFIPWMTAACTDGYAAMKNDEFAKFALEMNDWLCALQYAEAPDPRRPLWRGGFKKIADGKLQMSSPPGVEAALYAQSLADCCRLIRMMPRPDRQRYDRYREASISALQFLEVLQFTDANTTHMAANYRNLLVGGFHPTFTDGNLRVDQTAACVSAFVQFLTSGADQAQ